MQKQVVEFARNSKYYMKIRYRYQVLFTAFNPCFPLDILALRTMTVAATVITYTNVPALIALIKVSSQ
jgi:hypothetical protein